MFIGDDVLHIRLKGSLRLPETYASIFPPFWAKFLHQEVIFPHKYYPEVPKFLSRKSEVVFSTYTCHWIAI